MEVGGSLNQTGLFYNEGYYKLIITIIVLEREQSVEEREKLLKERARQNRDEEV